MTTLREHLITSSRVYCARRGISLATLASLVARDGKFFARITSGGDCSTGMYERFIKYFADHPVSGATAPMERPQGSFPQARTVSQAGAN